MMQPEELLEHGETLKIEDGDILVLRGVEISADAVDRLHRMTGKKFPVVSLPPGATVGVLRAEVAKALTEET